ncbi:MAG: type II secretion system protein GspM [Acidobacteriota bacterium]
MKKLSNRDKKVLSIGGSGAALIILIFYVILPFYEGNAEAAAELENKQRLLQRTLETLRHEDVYRAQVQLLDEALNEYRQRLLDASQVEVGKNQLEGIVRSLANEHGLRVVRTSPLPEQKVSDRYAKVSLQVHLEGGMSELTNFLYAVSSYPKALVVEDFFLANFRNRTQPRVNISGYIRLS